MSYIAIRISCSELIQDDIVEGLKGSYDEIIGYRHYEKKENAHIHLLLRMTVSDDTIRRRLFTLCPGRYATKIKQTKGANKGQPVDKSMLAYMTKGTYDPFINIGFSDAEIAEAKSKGYIKDDIPVSNHNSVEIPVLKTKKEQVTQHMLVVEIACRLHAITGEDYPAYDYDLIYSHTADVLREYKKGGDIYYVMKMMESVIMMIYPRDHRAMVLTAWNSRHKISY